jgi:hypothetical protein
MKKNSVNLPPNFQDFLDEKYDGGKQKVTNTNLDTKGTYPQVSVNTLVDTDSSYRRKLFKEYLFWKDKRGVDKQPKKDSFLNTKLFESYKKQISEDTTLLTQRNKYKRIEEDEGSFQALSEVGTVFASSLFKTLDVSEKEVLFDFVKDWQKASDSKEAWALHNYLLEHGVKGSSFGKKDEHKNVLTQDHRDLFNKAYAWQQACFAFLGVKTVTLYRGVTNVGPLTKGDKVKVESRPSCSFSLDSYVASNFGKVLQYEIPVDKIFMSPFVSKRLGESNESSNLENEEEYIVLGSSDMEGVFVRSGDRA